MNHRRPARAREFVSQPGGRLRTGLGQVALSFLDQAAYGLSTFLVTAVVSRSSEPADFVRFMVLWSLSWTICALSTELLVTPLRIELPRGELSWSVLADLQGISFVLALPITISAVAAVAMRQQGAASILGVLAIVSSGFSFVLRRAVLYTQASVGPAAINSVVNLTATILLLLTFQGLGQSSAQWGQVLAALALLLPLAMSLRSRWPSRWRVGSLLIQLSKSGVWLATGSGLRGLACSSGLMAMVAYANGVQAANALGQTFVLASPVQLASSALPLLLLPGLVRAASVGAGTFRRVLYQQFCLYLLCALVGLGALFVVFEWWRHLLVHQPEVAAVGYLPVALCVLGVLLSSWSGSALQAVRSIPYSFAAMVVAALSIPVGLISHVPPPYLASLPYAFSLLTQVALIVSAPVSPAHLVAVRTHEPQHRSRT